MIYMRKLQTPKPKKHLHINSERYHNKKQTCQNPYLGPTGMLKK